MKTADIPSLIAGFSRLADQLDVGTPSWQNRHDLFGVAAPAQPGPLHVLYDRRFSSADGRFCRGMALFRVETLNDRPDLLSGDRDLAQIEGLFPASADAFLASLPVRHA
ncbi:hypothetical protein THUN1379_25450 [Paludibacterium sp. THUN1379]|uniref:hypothetical protein n=1 Tax=Paludibacterium sp. THUN1379 TaxID=3112107 RepID=UPI00308677A5|nr:hypothetical protein THUN1379_25450 [Paludibacterium sp. THUN1379]